MRFLGSFWSLRQFKFFFVAAASTTALLWALASPAHGQSATESTQSPKKSEFDLGLRLDCFHDFNRPAGSSQDCLLVTGLDLDFRREVGSRVRAHVRLSPFAQPTVDWTDSPSLHLSESPELEAAPLSAFSLSLSPIHDLDLTLGTWDGAAILTSESKLPIWDTLADAGWRQLALITRLSLGVWPHGSVRLAIGNGEGEMLQNRDAQQYVGLVYQASVTKGIQLHLGASYDANSAGSERALWQSRELTTRCGLPRNSDEAAKGHATQRLLANLIWDGSETSTMSRGFRAAVGWHRSTSSDLDENTQLGITADDVAGCSALDPTEIFVESSPGAGLNTVTRSTLATSASMRIMDTWFVGADYRRRMTDFGTVDLVQSCSGFGASGECTVSGTPANILGQTAFTLGGGMDLADGLLLSLGWTRLGWDKNYDKFSWQGAKGSRSDERQIFNVRLAWNQRS